MAYTNVWSDVIPNDSAAANTVGAQLRQLRLDLHERLNTIAGYANAAALTDPLIPAYTPSIFVPVWGMSVTPTASTLLAPKDTTKAGLDVIQATHTSAYFFAPFVLPVGVTLGAINWVVVTASGTLTYAGQISEVASGGTVATQIGTYSGSGVSGSPLNLSSNGQIGHVTTVGSSYFAAVLLTPSAGGTTTMIGFSVAYTRPAVNVTV